MGPAKFTVRLSRAHYEQLMRIEEETGVSHRGLFEAMVLNCQELAKRHKAGTMSPAEQNTIRACWNVARRITADAKASEVNDRWQIKFDCDRELLQYAHDICKRKDVSVNSLMAATVAPWGSGWGGPAEHAVRAEWWAWVLATARRLDHGRRRKRNQG